MGSLSTGAKVALGAATLGAGAVLLFVLSIVLVVVGERYEVRELPASPPIQSARFETYTLWWRSRDRLTVRLDRAVALSTVVDLSVFGPLRPGMNAEGARRAAGPPARTWQDYRATRFDVFSTVSGAAEVGCLPDDSATGEACDWTLYGIPFLGAESVLSPGVRDLARAAQAGRPRSDSLEVDVCDDRECVNIPVVGTGDPRLTWFARR